MSDRQPVLVAAFAIGLVSVATALGTGLLSFTSGVDYDIDGDDCSVVSDTEFTCFADNVAPGGYNDITGSVFAEEEDSELDENGASSLLSQERVLTGDENGEFNSDEWIGFCRVKVLFEDASSDTGEVVLEGSFDSSYALGCRVDAEQEVKVPDNLQSLRGSDAEFAEITYILRDDSDNDSVFDRNDDCPNEAGQLENGCRNTLPSVSVDTPATVEDEVEFTVSASASDPDGQELSYSWSNGETGRSATYLYARSGVERELSVTVSDGLDSVTESATVQVVDGSTPSDGGSDGTGGDSNRGGLVSVLLELLSVLPLVSLG